MTNPQLNQAITIELIMHELDEARTLLKAYKASNDAADALIESQKQIIATQEEIIKVLKALAGVNDESKA